MTLLLTKINLSIVMKGLVCKLSIGGSLKGPNIALLLIS